jgi:hypothetical protein
MTNIWNNFAKYTLMKIFNKNKQTNKQTNIYLSQINI